MAGFFSFWSSVLDHPGRLTQTETITESLQPTELDATPPITASVSATIITSTAANPISQPEMILPQTNMPTPSAPPVSVSLSDNGNKTNPAKDIAISIVATFVTILLFLLALHYYRRRRRNVKFRLTERLYENSIVRRGGSIPKLDAMDNRNSLRDTNNNPMKDPLHPDIVAPMYSIHTLLPEGCSTDTHSMTDESGSTILPPSSSRVPILAGKHEIETWRSTLIGSTKASSQSRMLDGTQENVGTLQRQLEMMREQMDAIRGRMTVLLKASAQADV